MTINEVLDGATEGARIRRAGWDKGLEWRVNASRILYVDFVGSDACLSVDNATATDWERVPTEAEIEALRMAMLDAAQAAMAHYFLTGVCGEYFRPWRKAKDAYEAAKGAA